MLNVINKVKSYWIKEGLTNFFVKCLTILGFAKQKAVQRKLYK
jgi:hypothetical protein